jgi:hypothetical protein
MIEERHVVAYEPAGGAFRASLIASDPSMIAALMPVKLREGICERLLPFLLINV